MIRLSLIRELQQRARLKLSSALPMFAEKEPALYQRPGFVSRMQSRFTGAGPLLDRIKEAGSHRTFNATFHTHTRVSCNKSPVQDLPLSPARSKLPLSARQRQKKSIAATKIQQSQDDARAKAAATLFDTTPSFPHSEPLLVITGSMHEADELAAKFFPNTSEQQYFRLQQSLHALPPSAKMDRTTLTYRLAAASNGDAALAMRLLEQLTKGLPFSDIADLDSWKADAGIKHQTLKLAGLLSQTDEGYAMLKALNAGHSVFGRAVRVALQAGMASKRTNQADSQGLAVRTHAAACCMAHSVTTLNSAQKAAIFSWEQGFRDDAAGSPLHRTQKELARFAHKSIPRGEKSQFKTFVPRLCGKRKSPLLALNKGVHGANRPALAVERERVQMAMNATVSSLLDNLLKDPGEILREADPLGALAVLASLRYWAKNPDAYPGQCVDVRNCEGLAGEMKAILATINKSDQRRHTAKFAILKNTVGAMLNYPDDALNDSPAVRRLVRQPLTPKRLAAWGKARKLDVDDPFWHYLRELNVRMKPRGFRLLERRTIGTHKTLEMLVEDMHSSSRLRLTDGSRRGISTRGLSLNLGRALNLTGIPFGPRLNIGYERRQRAVVEIGRSRRGGEILMGTERCRRGTAGAGLMIGYDLSFGPAQARMALSVDGERVHRKTEFTGIALRVAQRAKADGTPDDGRRVQEMRRIMEFMFVEQQKDLQASPESLFERFAATFFDSPDISLSWNGSDTDAVKYGVAAVASSLARIPNAPLNVGVGVGITADRTSTRVTDRGNATGRLRTILSRVGKTTDVELSVGFRGKISGESMSNDRNDQSGPGVGILNASLPAWSIPIYNGGSTGRALLVRENGRLLPAHCVLDLEFSRAADFIDGTQADRSRWIEQSSKRLGGDAQAKRLAGKQLDNFLGMVRHHQRRNQRLVQRMCLREDVASEIDRHCATASIIRDSTHIPVQERDRLCAARDAACARLVTQPGAWVPQELKMIERSAGYSRLGLLLGVHIATETSAEGEHQLASFKV